MQTIASVSFLNAKPLVDGLEDEPGLTLLSYVPARLLDTLVERAAQVALCPVIDFQLAPCDLAIVPAGCIGSDGATLTVRVFSHSPLEDLCRVHVDGDSHTSVALLQVVFAERYGRRLELSTLRLRGVTGSDEPHDALLLIGDKVVRDEPDPILYPFQLDLGEAWKDLTGLPFVFAIWMARADAELGDLPALLLRRRQANSRRIPEIVTAHARSLGWPDDLATRYLEDVLRFELGPQELESIQLFWSKCHALGLIEKLRPMRLYGNSQF